MRPWPLLTLVLTLTALAGVVAVTVLGIKLRDKHQCVSYPSKNSLVKSIEDLREKREELNKQILEEEDKAAKIQKELSVLTDRLQEIYESLVRKKQARNEYDQTILEMELELLAYTRQGLALRALL